MATVLWEGLPPPKSLNSLLATAGHRLVTRGSADVAVVCTPTAARLPSAPRAGLKWLWASQARLSPLLATEAALAGAYDALWLGDAEAPRRLVARLSEMAVPEPAPAPSPTFVARSAASRAALHQLARAARTSMPVLITGETGTGKEVTARLLHTWSERRGGRFVPINCAAIPNELMEGELFGYAKGAFSGATKGFDGQLMAAAGGTVFLDEIDDTPLSLQMKLLRVLEDRVVTRLGESEPRQVDFRIVAATNRDLRELIARGAFGADLYERLAIVSIHLPPLRERQEDLPPLIEHFIARFQREEPTSPQGPVRVTPEALAALEAYPWPGNIRELRNVLFEVLVYKRAGNRDPPLGSAAARAAARGGARGARQRGAERHRARHGRGRLQPAHRGGGAGAAGAHPGAGAFGRQRLAGGGAAGRGGPGTLRRSRGHRSLHDAHGSDWLAAPEGRCYLGGDPSVPVNVAPLTTLPPLGPGTARRAGRLAAADVGQHGPLLRDGAEPGHLPLRDPGAGDRKIGSPAHLNSDITLLRGAAGFFGASADVTREEFRRYVERLDLRRYDPGVQGFGFALRIPSSDGSGWVEKTRADGLPSFHIWPDGSPRGVPPHPLPGAAGRPERGGDGLRHVHGAPAPRGHGARLASRGARAVGPGAAQAGDRRGQAGGVPAVRAGVPGREHPLHRGRAPGGAPGVRLQPLPRGGLVHRHLPARALAADPLPRL